ncbi:hypothetical protein [Rheinheimera sp.]|uniref:hypothetical protein n=1 Tax=Rheinheimera sp. TaxID=1869214 RepID=UPI0027B89015|nr:hypothetical protein [Rheinheimera sp.]
MRILPLLLTSALLFGCGEESDTKEATSSAATIAEVPESNAVKFFNAILIENDLKKAKKLAVPSMARVLDSYSTGKAAGRTLFNMRFDKLEITVEDTNKNVREFYTDKADVMLIFTGEYDGDRRVDMRMVKLVNQKGKWLISEVKTDPFARTGV